NVGRVTVKGKTSGLEAILEGIHRAADERAANPGFDSFARRSEQFWWELSTEAALVRSSLLSMATAIVDAAGAGRAIWRSAHRLPVSFFVTHRDDAVEMIAEALQKDDKRFRVQAKIGQPAAANAIDDSELLQLVRRDLAADVGLTKRAAIIRHAG